METAPVFRRLILAVSLLACAGSAPAQRSMLRADEAIYELRGPEDAALARKGGPSHNVGSTHGDQIRAPLTQDVLTIPASIPSTLPLARLVVPVPLPQSAAPDVVGAFRFICQPGQISYDDPIVYPGQPGKSHLHQWYGNTAANASSTYESLRSTGDSTCMNTLNRSAYWMPAMLDGKGHVVRPDYVTVYYKGFPPESKECREVALQGCVTLPRGLRMIFGYDMVTSTKATGEAYFNCDGPTAKPGHYPTITEAAANCPAGNRLGAVIVAPHCWDGKRLDSPNHRDHVAYGRYDNQGRYACPSKYPKAIPGFTMGAWYTVADDGAGGWYLSSDEMPGMERMPAGSTFHADWFGAWDDETMATWMSHCVDRMLNCSGGNLGNGRQLKQVGDFSWNTPKRLVPVPPRPGSKTP